MLILLRFMETHGVALGYWGDKIRYILIIRVREKLCGESNMDYKDITDFISHIAKRNTMGFHET